MDRMKKKIGGGAFGEVYKAKWKGSDVAVKILISQSHSEQTIQVKFQQLLVTLKGFFL